MKKRSKTYVVVRALWLVSVIASLVFFAWWMGGQSFSGIAIGSFVWGGVTSVLFLLWWSVFILSDESGEAPPAKSMSKKRAGDLRLLNAEVQVKVASEWATWVKTFEKQIHFALRMLVGFLFCVGGIGLLLTKQQGTEAPGYILISTGAAFFGAHLAAKLREIWYGNREEADRKKKREQPLGEEALKDNAELPSPDKKRNGTNQEESPRLPGMSSESEPKPKPCSRNESGNGS